MDTYGDDSLNLRRSTRRLIIQSKAEFESGTSSPSTSIDTRNRKRTLSDPSVEEDTPTSSPWRRRVKRVKEERLESGGRGRLRRSSQLVTASASYRHGHQKVPRCRLTEERVPVRRSKREKRLMFSSLNLSAMEKQLLNPHAGFPVLDSSDEEMEPYEKILSPHRKLMSRKKTKTSTPTSLSVSATASEPMFGMTLRSSNQLDQSAMSADAVAEGEENGEGGRGPVSEKGAVEEGDDSSSEGEEEREEESESENSQSEDEGEGGYYLRKRRPVIYQYQPVIQVVDEETKPKRRRRQVTRNHYDKPSMTRAPQAYQPRRRRAHQDSSTTSSGSDSDEAKFRRRKARSMKKARSQCLPMNFDPKDTAQGIVRDRVRIGASLADVDPMNINRDVTFDSVGGLQHHIRALKEMIIFPLLYPEVFDRFKIQPPRGVLFYGPPGCGKTLVARALANECSKGGKKVAFFMRKGADCLSKWVGESERQLRLLFDQAYQMRPSIIFFDEIDGLAPVRSSRQDQIHSSIVSTLLALMDGLDSRGEIVVIGATNRIDTIDPALRRPGRFDREFLFPLPSREDRLSILNIHTKAWDPPLKPEFISELSDNTVGYCGADLKGLCTEAALFALRRKYPQIYQTADKLVLDVSKINVAASDFHNALKAIVPTAQRSDLSVACALSEHIRPLLIRQFKSLLSLVSFTFPPSWKSVSKAQKSVTTALATEKQSYNEMAVCVSEIHDDGMEIFPREAQSSAHLDPITTAASFSRGEGMDMALKKVRNLRNDPGMIAESNRESLFSQLYQKRQPADLDEVYFDTNETLFEDRNETMSILINEDLQANSPGSNVPAKPSAINPHRYLSLSTHPHTTPTVHSPRLIICGEELMGQSTHLAPALLHALEDLPVKVLDLSALFATSTKTPEEACTQVFREARRVTPSIVYIPRISSWWDVTSDTFRATFVSTLLSLPTSTPLLVVATSECPWGELPLGIREIFRGLDNNCFSIHHPSLEERKLFFFRTLLQRPLEPPPLKPKPAADVELESLPVAPTPKPRELSQVELDRIEQQRQAVVRELRVFLRDVTNKLLAERKFKEFAKPVNAEEVPDYYDIIAEPMDLSMIMKKVDEHRYTVPKLWLNDVDLITRNSLEYNPEHDSESRLLRHRAVALQDMAHSILDHELNEDFERQCEEIDATYKRLASASQPTSVSTTAATTTNPGQFFQTGPSNVSPGGSKSSRRSLRQLGILPEGSGLPYYAPPKPRTPRKGDTESEESIMGTPNGNPDTSNDSTENSGHGRGGNTEVIEPLAPANTENDIDGRLKPCQELGVTGEHKAKRQLWQESESPLSEPHATGETLHEGKVRRRSSRLSSQEECDQTTQDVDQGGSSKEVEVSHSQQGDECEIPEPVIVDRKRLLEIFERVVQLTATSNVEQMECLHSTLEHVVFRHRMKRSREQLVEDLEVVTELFAKSCSS